MNNIYETLNLSYLNCSTGTCEHVVHDFNMYLWLSVAMLVLMIKYQYDHQN